MFTGVVNHQLTIMHFFNVIINAYKTIDVYVTCCLTCYDY